MYRVLEAMPRKNQVLLRFYQRPSSGFWTEVWSDDGTQVTLLLCCAVEAAQLMGTKSTFENENGIFVRKLIVTSFSNILTKVVCVKLPQVSVKCKSSENFASLLWNILGWWAVQYKPCKWRVDNNRSIYYVIKNVGAGLWERYIVYSCGYIQMFLVEQLLSIHINLAWRATHPCCWYYAFILPIGRYTANWRWRKAISLL